MSAYNVVSRAAMAAGQPEDISVVLANLDAIASIINGGLDNSNLGAAAAIAYSKLALANSILGSDIAVAAAIDPAKLKLSAGAAARAANQAIPFGGVWTYFAFDTTLINLNESTPMANLGVNNDRITIRTSGVYLTLGQIFENDVNEAISFVGRWDRLNAANVIQTSWGTSAGVVNMAGLSSQGGSGFGIENCVAGDYYKLAVYNSSAGTNHNFTGRLFVIRIG